MRQLFKAIMMGPALLIGALVGAPVRLAMTFGSADRQVQWLSQWAGQWIGLPGEYTRRATLAWVLEDCARDCLIGFGTQFSRRGARVGARAYIGPGCNLGLVTLGEDCLLGSGVHVLSGKTQHKFEDPDIPIREQGGDFSRVTIGRGAWLGNASVVLADVGDGAVVGAGSVVTKEIPAGAIAVGNPARIVGQRPTPGTGA